MLVNVNGSSIRALLRTKPLAALILFFVIGILTVPWIVLRVHSQKQKPARTAPLISHPFQPALPSLYAGPTLRIDSVVQHGQIVEIDGSTDPGAIVMINGERAAVIFDHNSFHHFLGPLPSGTTIIAVTSQDEHGGVNTKQVAVTIQ
jgi:hypothetical protein